MRKSRPIGDFQTNHIENDQKSKESHEKDKNDPKSNVDQKWPRMLIRSSDPINLRPEMSF